MSGIDRFVVDTNIIIFYLKGNTNVNKYFIDSDAVISFINELEVLSGAYFYPDELEKISNFLKDQIVIEYIPEIKNIIVRLRARKKLKLPDCIVAATAIYLNLPLVSADKDFANIPGLDFIHHDPSVS